MREVSKVRSYLKTACRAEGFRRRKSFRELAFGTWLHRVTQSDSKWSTVGSARTLVSALSTREGPGHVNASCRLQVLQGLARHVTECAGRLQGKGRESDTGSSRSTDCLEEEGSGQPPAADAMQRRRGSMSGLLKRTQKFWFYVEMHSF